MSRIGNNMKLNVGKSHRDALHRMMVEVLQAESESAGPDLQLYRFDDHLLGIYYVDDASALSVEQHEMGMWLEFVVPDPAALDERLREVGAKRMQYQANEHAYYQSPGGLVFRLEAE